MPFVWKLIGMRQVPLLWHLQLAISFSFSLSFRALIIVYISVGIHIRRTALANFHIGTAKKSLQFVMRRKMLI